ncbi:MAG: lysophospholipid acyltransferase family protein [Burkholderiaceae bacterium]|nr:lysophospholipid acyltransferase family protein [Burkholderiaceae bacterium]
MILFFKWFSHLPLWLAHLIGAVLGWVVFAASPTYRRRFLANSRFAGYSFGQVAGAVAHTGRMVAELPKLWMSDQGNQQGQAQAPFEWDQASSIACVEAAYQKGKGVIFLTPHLGCFEIVAQALAQQFSAQYGRLTVLYRPARKVWMAKLVANSRSRPGLSAVPTNLSGVRQMIKALRKGEAVGLLPDQVPPDGMGLWVPFFGKDAYTMTLAARLAAQTGATVLVSWGERLPWGRGYKLHFYELDQGLEGDLDAALARMNGAMEGLIRDCPTQYLWGYGRYKHPRQEPGKESTSTRDKSA